jgi:hypothetical protein
MFRLLAILVACLLGTNVLVACLLGTDAETPQSIPRRSSGPREGACPDPLRGKSFTVTGAKCDPNSGSCFQKGPLFGCEGARACARAVRDVLDRCGQNISWVVLVPDALSGN